MATIDLSIVDPPEALLQMKELIREAGNAAKLEIFNLDMFHFRLVLDNVKGRDEGSYKCRVDFRQAPTRISNIDLHVIGKEFTMN